MSRRSGIRPDRLAGHSLSGAGAPHDRDGDRINPTGTGGQGRARCSCGALSPVLSSAGQRHAWHRQHKADVREAGA